MDPYKVMQVGKNYTMEQLRTNFKRLVLEYHPDRNADVSKSQIFLTLKFSYDYLINELKTRELDKDHITLKQQQQQHQQDGSISNAQNIKFSKDKFDLTKFNQMFSESRIQEVYDDGYGNWVEDTPKGDKAIITYKEPEAMLGSKFAGAYELGASKIDDYSNDNVGRGLKYMDFKLAHTTSLLVDQNHVESRDEFKSIDDLKKHRGNVKFEQSPEDVRRRQLEQIENDKKEADRLVALRNKDSLISQLYGKTHKLMLSAFS